MVRCAGRSSGGFSGKRGDFRGIIVTVRFGVFTFHGERRQLFREGAEVHLTPKAFDLLAVLIERAPAVVAKSDIHRQLGRRLSFRMRRWWDW